MFDGELWSSMGDGSLPAKSRKRRQDVETSPTGGVSQGRKSRGVRSQTGEEIPLTRTLALVARIFGITMKN